MVHTPPLETDTGRKPVPSAEIKRLHLAAKRCLDIVLGALGLLLSIPLWIPIAIAIKVSDGGSIFYKQSRFGMDGIPFDLLKFRTMHPNGDPMDVYQAAVGDARITKVGRVLRATGMDELPQLLAILKGQMSLVGPRALAVGESIRRGDGPTIQYEMLPGFSERLRVKPGLTGLATVYLPKDADPLQKLEYDLRYIDEYSFWLDVRLILLSLRISFQGRWETRDPKL